MPFFRTEEANISQQVCLIKITHLGSNLSGCVKISIKAVFMKRICGYLKILIFTLLTALISLYFVNSFIKIYVGEVLTKSCGIRNSVTDFILRTVPEDEVKEDSVKPQIVIADSVQEPDRWQQMYPFKETSFIADYCETESLKLPVEEEIKTVTEQIFDFAGKYFSGFDWLSGKYGHPEAPETNEKKAEKPTSGYNVVVPLSDGYLTEYNPQSDMTEKALAVTALSEYCKKTGCGFLYIQEPYKIDKYHDTDVSGVLDFSNQNIDSFIELLKANGVSVLDFREVLHNAGLTRQQTFYRTDHHWLAETGFRASAYILKYLKENYKFNVDTEIINESGFSKKIYKDFFLGSQGKKVTLEKTEPDDFCLYYPKFETKLKVYIPNMGIDRIGDFTLLYNMYHVKVCDYYGRNPYAAYSYGDQPIMQISNELITDDDTKILLLHDSFCDCVIPFISLGTKNVHALDLRHFTGSLETYIDTEKPDIVIVSSVVTNGGKIYWSSHKDSFDFR